MKIEWLNDTFTTARLTDRAISYSWRNKVYVTADVHLDPNSLDILRNWIFTDTGQSVYEHSSGWHQLLSDEYRKIKAKAYEAKRKAALKNPWRTVAKLPIAKVIK